jgi:hypothetical protein
MGLINYLKRNISISKNSAQQLIKIAIAHEERGETADAIACYHRVIKADESWADGRPSFFISLAIVVAFSCLPFASPRASAVDTA